MRRKVFGGKYRNGHRRNANKSAREGVKGQVASFESGGNVLLARDRNLGKATKLMLTWT